MVRHDLITLQLFLSVARIGSIAGAAARHNMVASAVSKRISDLETQIGTPLLYRIRRGVELTAAGQELLSHTCSLESSIERMDADMMQYADGRLGTIRLAASSSAITQFLPEDLAEFIKSHPKLRVELTEQTSVDILDAVRNGLCDLGVFSGLTDAKGLKVLPYRRDTLVVATPPGHWLVGKLSVTLNDLLDEDFIGLQGSSSIQSYVKNAAATSGGDLKVRVTVQSFDGVCRMVQARLGIAILPYGAVEPYVREGELNMVPLAETWAKRDLLIAVRKPDTLQRHVRLLLESLTGS
jgi:DNA-binding transcriptional LysR family regulator